MNISKALRYVCEVKNVKQIELSEMTGLSKPHINQIYRGVVKNPKVESMYRICKALGISLDDFMDIAVRYR